MLCCCSLFFKVNIGTNYCYIVKILLIFKYVEIYVQVQEGKRDLITRTIFRFPVSAVFQFISVGIGVELGLASRRPPYPKFCHLRRNLLLAGTNFRFKNFLL